MLGFLDNEYKHCYCSNKETIVGNLEFPEPGPELLNNSCFRKASGNG